MPSAKHTVTIHRSAEDVFAYVLDGEKCPEWRPGVTDIKRISGDGGVGTMYAQGVRGPIGRRIAADYRVSVCEPGRILEFQTVAGPVRPHGRYEIAPEGDGSRLSLSLDADLSGFRAVLVGRAVQRTMDSEVQAIDRMKAVLEGRAASLRSS